MNPPTEQLIRDYLNRLSVAARGRLGSAERREFLARMRESIERETGPAGTADPAEVRNLLAELGEPATLIERERARLARGEPGPAAPRSGHRTARSAAWLSARTWHTPELSGPLNLPARPATEVPLTGEVRIQSRSISARWRPGGQLQPRPSGQHRPPWTRTGAKPAGTAASTVSSPDTGGPDTGGPDTGGPDTGAPDTGAPGSPAGPERGPVSAASNGSPAPDDPQSPSGSWLWPPRSGAQPEQPDQTARFPARMTAASRPGGSARLAGAGADLGQVIGTVVALARRYPLEAAAVVLLGLGGLIYPPVWLLGAVVALLSKHWDFRDKWVGLAGPVLLMIVGTGILLVHAGTRDSIGAYAREAWTFAGYLSRAGAVLGAVYLTWRVQRGRREPPVPPWNRPHRL